MANDRIWINKASAWSRENPEHFEKIGGQIRTSSRFKAQNPGILIGRSRNARKMDSRMGTNDLEVGSLDESKASGVLPSEGK